MFYIKILVLFYIKILVWESHSSIYTLNKNAVGVLNPLARDKKNIIYHNDVTSESLIIHALHMPITS